MAGIGSVLGGVAGGIIGGPIGATIGSGLGGAIDANERENEAARQRNLEYARQKEFAQMGIRWKVEDAKAAGLHPLYAMGGSTAQYSPQATIGDDLGDMGQDVSRAALTAATPKEVEDIEWQRAGVRAAVRKDISLSALYDAQAEALRRGRAPDGSASGGLGASLESDVAPGPVNTVINPGFRMPLNEVPGYHGWVQNKPDEAISRDFLERWRTANDHPMISTYDSPSGRVHLLSDKAAQSLQDLNPFVAAYLLGYNLNEIYGDRGPAGPYKNYENIWKEDPAMKWGPGEFGLPGGRRPTPGWRQMQRLRQRYGLE